MSERDAMLRALELAATPGVPFGPNPRVGCVLLAPDGSVVAEGFHRGAGTPHAEVDALTTAGDAARGTTAVVTLEPCNHTGRTGPCSQALLAAGVRRVIFAQADSNPVATGGADALRAAGVDVEAGLLGAEASALNRGWAHGLVHDRPFVIWKFATTLDGRAGAADGTSRWISSRAARLDAHRLRSRSDVILVGTGTVVADDPALTVRDEHDELRPHQPLRAVMGDRELDPGRKVFDDAAETVHLRTPVPLLGLHELFALGRRDVFLEGGPTLAGAFLRAGLVDEIVVYVAPVLLGAGPPSVADLGIATITEAFRPEVVDVTVLEPIDPGDQPNVRLTLRPHPARLP
ncbi:MAG TPA: bifunctional diaminohydroxyphosphoribosylaminopyrimidine deaminase/5-amino-6-(5-phosphoribosylamino)uracil reductase RibD [Acidimicrobiales bacterium]